MPSIESTIQTIQSPELTCNIRLAALLQETSEKHDAQPLLSQLVDEIVGKPDYQLALTDEQVNEWHHRHYDTYQQITLALQKEAAKRWLSERSAV